MLAQPSEKAPVVDFINPQNANNSTKNSSGIDMSKFYEAYFVLILGSQDSTVDMKLQESNASDFSSGVSDISGKATGPPIPPTSQIPSHRLVV